MRAQIPILSSQSIFLFGKSSASCTFYLGSMELLCTLGGNVINPDRSEKKLIGQGHLRQNLGSVVHCIGRLHHLHQHWHRRHRDWGQGSVSVLRVTINIFTISLYFGAAVRFYCTCEEVNIRCWRCLYIVVSVACWLLSRIQVASY